MGRVIDVKCNKCNYSERFFLGMGMRDWDKNVVVTNFNSDRAKEILDSDDSWSFNWKLAICDECKALVRVPVLDVFNEVNGKFEFIECTCQCGTRINRTIDVPENVSQINVACPHCEEKMEVSENMLWD